MDPRLISYLYYFNVKADYFECHEYGESLWLDTGRPVVLKGLIQAAVCLYHLEGGNVRGGWRMWQRARNYLADARPVYEGMDIARLTADIDAVFDRVPSDWQTQIVSTSGIRSLELPEVKVQIVDPDLLNRLSTWQPEPLGHGS